MGKVLDNFRLDGRVVIITGGAGLLGAKHAEAVAEAGGNPVLWDRDAHRAAAVASKVEELCGVMPPVVAVDITSLESVERAFKETLSTNGKVHALINNAANNPQVKNDGSINRSRLENFPLEAWNQDVAVGLTGGFLVSQVVGAYMAEHGGGVILNMASDLGVIAPDQRIYRKEGIPEHEQPAKPVTYSVVKHGLIGLTKYLATYWADKNVRVNSISPGGVYTSQPEEFVAKLTNLIPLGRMATRDEYKAAVIFLISDASAYMTGSNVVMDGGRTCW